MSWAIETAARTLWQEARGEPAAGQQAVAWVIRNRLASGRWGHSLASVCLWRAQFSGWYVPADPNFAGACNLADNDPLLLSMMNIITSVMAADPASDPTGGAINYFACSMAQPPVWASTMTFCGQIGHQNFYRPNTEPPGSTIA
jgi:spore germination cell wall hydrolase CwlJ-like protein